MRRLGGTAFLLLLLFALVVSEDSEEIDRCEDLNKIEEEIKKRTQSDDYYATDGAPGNMLSKAHRKVIEDAFNFIRALLVNGCSDASLRYSQYVKMVYVPSLEKNSVFTCADAKNWETEPSVEDGSVHIGYNKKSDNGQPWPNVVSAWLGTAAAVQVEENNPKWNSEWHAWIYYAGLGPLNFACFRLECSEKFYIRCNYEPGVSPDPNIPTEKGEPCNKDKDCEPYSDANFDYVKTCDTALGLCDVKVGAARTKTTSTLRPTTTKKASATKTPPPSGKDGKPKTPKPTTAAPTKTTTSGTFAMTISTFLMILTTLTL